MNTCEFILYLVLFLCNYIYLKNLYENDINKYYFKVPNEEGGYDTVINPKTNAELTLDDIKFNRF